MASTDRSAVANLLVEHAMFVIRARYEDVERLSFHNRAHTKGVVDRSFLIARAMGLEAPHAALARIASAYHDTVQNWSRRNGADGWATRVRDGGLNEMASAQEALLSMKNSEHPFMPFEYGLVWGAIHATIPGWSPEDQTVTQPFLTPASHPVVRAVALADLGDAGMDAESFGKAGFALFAEDNLDVVETLSRVRRASSIPQERQREIRERVVAWLQTQAPFAEGRRKRLREELGEFADGSVEWLFNQFDESIRRATENVQIAQSATFTELGRMLLPSVFPGEV